MLKEKDSIIRRAMLVFDAFVVIMAFLLSFLLRRYLFVFYNLDIIPSSAVMTRMSATMSDYFIILLFVVVLWCGTLYLNGMYRSMRTKTITEVVWIIFKSAFLITLTFGAFVFLLKLKYVSRVFFIIFMALSSSAILFEKIAVFSVIRYARRQGYNYRRLLIVGTGRRAGNFIDRIKCHPEWGFKIKGVVNDDGNRQVRYVRDLKVVGMLKDIPNLLHKFSIDGVIFVVPRSRLNYITDSLYACEIEGVKATIAVDLFDFKIAKSYQSELDGIPLITFETTFAEGWQLFVKRGVDIIASGFGLLMLFPFFLLTAILIKLTSAGPIFFAQKRIGISGRYFTLYKFRTMHKDAHKKLEQVADLNEMNGPIFKIKNDPRLTKLGKILRKFSIDELPQLYNVFVGHMSLVGPRPPLPREVKQYKPWQRRRLSMRPGLTCIWQVSGRNKVDFDEWMKLDLKYLDTWSLWLDFKILMKTVPIVLFGVGAY